MTTREQLEAVDGEVHELQQKLLNAGAQPEIIEVATEGLRTRRVEFARQVEIAELIAAHQDLMIHPEELGRVLVDVRRALGESQTAWGRRLGVGAPQVMRYEHHRYRGVSWKAILGLLESLSATTEIKLSWRSPSGQ